MALFGYKSYTQQSTAAACASACFSCASHNAVHVAGTVLLAVPVFVIAIILLARLEMIIIAGLVISVIIALLSKKRILQSCFKKVL